MSLQPPETYELDQTVEAATGDHTSDSESDGEGDTKVLYQDDPLAEKSRKEPRTRSSSLRKRNGWKRWLIPTRFCCILIALFFATVVSILAVGGFWVIKHATPPEGESEPWYPSPRGGTVKSWQNSYKKAGKLVGQMTLVEKVNVTTGVGWMMGLCVGNTGPVPRLNFPSLCLQDGPLGLRFADNSTAWPAGITVGATWNQALMYERGKAHGLEARLKGINVLLGPAMGPFGRLPAGGRNWEGFGPDPVLQGVAAAQTIRGIQHSGVIATAKHYVANEQEHFRQSWEWGTPNALSSNIDDRTMHELYAWPFAESVRAGVGSVMCSYNQVNHSYACDNSKLLNGILKDELGFQGFVQSDWLAQRAGVASSLAGLDMTMPGDGLGWQDGKSLWGAELTKSVLNGTVPVERINDMALRIVAAWYQLGQDDEERWPKVENGGGPNFSSWTDDKAGQLHPGSPNSKEEGEVNKFVPVRHTEEGGDHDILSRIIATEGIVLVKNEDSFLPLSRNGSSIKTRNSSGKVKIGIFGEDAYPNPKGRNACKDRGCNIGTLAMGWGSGAVELPYLLAPATALHAYFDSQMVEVTDWETNEIKHIGAVAREQDICLAFINSDAGEGFTAWEDVKGDRNDLYAQKNGDDLVQTVAASCKNVVVVLHTVGPTILDRWIDMPSVKAVLVAHLPGQESGSSLAHVLLGDVNPSGHLPYTIAKREQDYGPDSKILTMPKSLVPQQNFTEGLYVDYRYFDKQGIAPRYEFGFGLSYTTFTLSTLFVMASGLTSPLPAKRPKPYSPPRLSIEVPDPEEAVWPTGLRKLKKYVYPYIKNVDEIKEGHYPYPNGYDVYHSASPAGGGEGGNPSLYETAVTVQAAVTNVGAVAGSAVVQVYVSYPPNVTDSEGVSVDMPVRVLRGFAKRHLGTNTEDRRQQVRFELTRKDVSFWDVKAQNWRLPEGEFGIELGFSSRDLPEKKRVIVLVPPKE